MKVIDVICLTNTANDQYFDLCFNTLKTLCESESGYIFNINLMESCAEPNLNYFKLNRIAFKGSIPLINYIHPNEKFNYNRFINIGLQYLRPDAEWLIIMNNDLLFQHGWMGKLLKAHEERPDIESFSTYDPNIHKYYSNKFAGDENILEGYDVPTRVTGWLLFIKKSVIKSIMACGGFDERFTFWYQDNDYAQTIKSLGIKHALVRDCVVIHLHESSHSLIEDEERIKITKGLRELFITKWNYNEQES